MFGFTWLRQLFVRDLNQHFNQLDSELEGMVEARVEKLAARLQSRIAERFTRDADEPIDVEWEPAAPRLTFQQDRPAKPVKVSRHKTRKPAVKVVKRGRKAKRAA